MSTKRFALAIVLGLVAVMPAVQGVLQSSIPEAAAAQTRLTLPKLETFDIIVENPRLNKDAESAAPPPRAVVTAKVRLVNLGMEEKRDVLLHLTLENNRGEIIAESSLLVYVPYQKTNTYTIDILTREGGNLQLIAEVVSQGRAVVAEPVDLSISPMDLFV